jgi:hypothetical protein
MEIYKKDQYLNENVPFIISNMIREYDIHSAGLNILFWKKAITKREYERLSSLDKIERNIQIGLMMRSNSKLTDILKAGFEEVRCLFLQANKLTEDDILSIKKDALFIINKRPTQTTIEQIEFINKNTYTSYYYLNKLEFYYYIRDDRIDVKGISDITLQQHKDYFISFLKTIFRLAERSEARIIRKKIREFSEDYKKLKLDVEYYRELNYDSLFKIYNFQINGELLAMDSIDKSMLNDGFVDISYNYMSYIVPLINIFF